MEEMTDEAIRATPLFAALEEALKPVKLAIGEADVALRSPVATLPPPVKQLTPEERHELEAVAVAAGVHSFAVSDFTRRCEVQRVTMESPSDPTRDCASVEEFTEFLRTDAPHLFSPKASKTDNAIVADEWMR
jgi:hypothetical protein